MNNIAKLIREIMHKDVEQLVVPDYPNGRAELFWNPVDREVYWNSGDFRYTLHEDNGFTIQYIGSPLVNNQGQQSLQQLLAQENDEAYRVASELKEFLNMSDEEFGIWLRRGDENIV